MSSPSRTNSRERRERERGERRERRERKICQQHDDTIGHSMPL